MSERRKLVITDADLAAPAPPTPAFAPTVGAVAGANGLPPVAGVKPPPLSLGTMGAPVAARPARGGLALGSTLVSSTIGAFVAALLGWAVLELIGSDSSEHLVRTTALEFGAVGAVFGAVYAAWDDITSRVWEPAVAAAGIGAVVGAVCGAASGAVAQQLYGSIMEDIIRTALTTGEVPSPTSFKLCAARAVAWAIFGGGIGLAAGIAKRSSRKTVNAVVGGVVGAAIGGYLFNYIGEATGSDLASRLIGLAVVGLAMGVAIGLVETARRQAWVKLVAGGMTGKEFILYHSATVIGSSPKAQITLIKDPAVAPMHLRIDEHGPRRALTAFDGCPVAVNGVAVTSHWLHDGDVVQVGHSALHYQERKTA